MRKFFILGVSLENLFKWFRHLIKKDLMPLFGVFLGMLNWDDTSIKPEPSGENWKHVGILYYELEREISRFPW